MRHLPICNSSFSRLLFLDVFLVTSMRSSATLFLAVLAISCASSSAHGQNFFWSLDGFGEGAANEDLVIDGFSNPAGTIFLYYEASGQNITEGIDFDFSWLPSFGSSNVAEFTAADTFEADILLNGTIDLGDRWGDAFGPASVVNSNEVLGFTTVNVVGGTGIQVENRPGVLDGNGLDFVDSLFDETANAFLVGSINYETNENIGASELLVSGIAVN